MVESRSKRYFTSKRKYLLFTATNLFAGGYLLIALVGDILKLDMSFVSYSCVPVFLAFIAMQLVIFHDLKPLAPEEFAKYESKIRRIGFETRLRFGHADHDPSRK